MYVNAAATLTTSNTFVAALIFPFYIGANRAGQTLCLKNMNMALDSSKCRRLQCIVVCDIVVYKIKALLRCIRDLSK